MKLISWNVNGIRAAMGKGFVAFAEEESPDILCVQETKMQEGQAQVPLEDYHQYWCSAEKKGYSGTAVFTKEEPLSVTRGMDIPEHDREGRVLTAEYSKFYLVNVYTPNSQDGLKRLDYRMEWDDAFRAYLKGLEQKKPVITCGDFNVAHREIDLKNPKTNQKNAGFTPQEREKMTALQEAGFIDTWRYFYPDLEGGLFLVELPVQRPQKQRRLAYRLFPGVEGPGGEPAGRPYPDPGLRQRPLPGGAGDRGVREKALPLRPMNEKKAGLAPVFYCEKNKKMQDTLCDCNCSVSLGGL